MDFQGLPIRSAIPRSDLYRGLKEPESSAKRGMNRMLTANRTPKALKAPQSDGVPCPKCGKAHRAGTICGFDKSVEFQRALDEITKGGSNRWPSGAPEGKGGQFAPKGSGKPTQGMKHSGPKGKKEESAKKKPIAQPEPSTVRGERATPTATQELREQGKQFQEAHGRAVDRIDEAGERARSARERGRAARAEFDPSATGAATPSAKREEKEPASISQQLRQMQEASKKEGEKLQQAAQKKREQDPLMARMERAAQDKAKYEKLVGERMQAEPEKFRGGVHEPRKERMGEAETQRIEDVQRHPLEPKDEYHAAQLKSGQEAYDRAHKQALEQGADPVEAAVAANQAWQQSFQAHEEARRQGIPVEQIAEREAELAQTGQIKPGATTEQLEAWRSAVQAGKDPTDAAREALGFPGGGQQQKPPGGITLPPDQGPMQLVGPQGQPLPQPPSKTPAGTVPPTVQPPGATPGATPGDGTPPTRPTRRQLNWPGIGFSQMYGAGQSIGAAEGTPGGVVTPAAGLAAQQVHHLLNPQVRRYAAPAIAGSPRAGSVGTSAGPVSPQMRSSQSSLKQPAMKSLIDWKNKYEYRT